MEGGACRKLFEGPLDLWGPSWAELSVEHVAGNREHDLPYNSSGNQEDGGLTKRGEEALEDRNWMALDDACIRTLEKRRHVLDTIRWGKKKGKQTQIERRLSFTWAYH